MSASAPRRPAHRWIGVLKVLVAAAVLGLVVRAVPWRDTLVWRGGEREVTGSILGSWSQETVRFQAQPQDLAGADLPPELRARFDAEGLLEATRGAELDWRPGMPRVFRDVRPGGLALAFVSILIGVLFTTTRWWRLLHAAGCPTRWLDALRLTFLGFFFNIVVPGLTGGDLVKAFLAAREHPQRRAAAVVSVAVDRLLGLFALALLGAGVVLALGDRFGELRLPVLLFVVGGAAGAGLYSSRTLRRLLRFDALLARLPMGGAVRQIDEAVLIYSRHPGEVAVSLLLSLGNHLCVIAGIYVLGRAFGEMLLSVWEYVAVVSMGNIASALPVAPGGWGVGEAAYGFLFSMLGASATLGVAVSVTFRLCLMAIGLLGGVCLLLPGGRAELARLEDLKRAAAVPPGAPATRSHSSTPPVPPAFPAKAPSQE